MAAAPVFAVTPNVTVNGPLSAANVARDGTGATGRVLIFTAGASGSVFGHAQIASLGTNAACVLRFFLNNGSDPEVGANNLLLDELAFVATTASETVAQQSYRKAFGISIPTGYRVYVTRSAFTGGNAGIAVSGFGMNF